MATIINDNSINTSSTWSSEKIVEYTNTLTPQDSSILATQLDGLLIANSSINDNDSILTAFGKLQGQINNFDISSDSILATQLDGFVAGSNTLIDSNDTILTGFNKTQGQINSINSSINDLTELVDNVNLANIPTVTTTTLDSTKQYAFKPNANGSIKDGSFVIVESSGGGETTLNPATETSLGGLMLSGNKLTLNGAGKITNIVADQIKDTNTTNPTSEWHGTTAQYNAITSKDPNTTYYITDEDGGVSADSIINKNTETGSIVNINVWMGTEAQYQALVDASTLDNNMLYITY